MTGSAKAVLRHLLPNTLRPHRILAGPLKGVWMVTSWHDYPAGLTGKTERPLLEWFQKHVRSGETWLDIGGHYGYTAFALARLTGDVGRVFTFEPVCASAGCIDQGRLLNRMHQLTVMTYGLGSPDTMTTVRLPLTRGMADSTLTAGADTMFATIVVARFDWLWPRINDSNAAVHGVKIDVQGMELDVLRGMIDMLRASRPALVVELHRGVDRRAIVQLLTDTGYSPEPHPIDTTASKGAELLDDHSYAFFARAS